MLDNVNTNETLKKLIVNIREKQNDMAINLGDGIGSSICLFLKGKELKLGKSLKDYGIKNYTTLEWLNGLYCNNSSKEYLDNGFNMGIKVKGEKKVKKDMKKNTKKGGKK